MDTTILNEEVLNVSAVSYDKLFLKNSWNWLHDAEIKYLTMSPSITKEQQYTWFETLGNRPDYKIWGVQVGDTPIGAFGIKNIDGLSGEYWGYIGEKSYWGKGIGSWMVQKAIDIGTSMELKRIYLKVLQDNHRAVKLYIKHGFCIQSTDDNIFWMEREI